MRQFIILFALFLGASSIFAQPLNRPTYATMIRTAEEQMELKDYYRALEYYEDAYLESKDKELSAIIADLNYMLRDYRKAERAYARILKRDKKNEWGDKRFEYARCLKMNGKYKNAIKEFDTFLATATDPVRKELAELEKTGAEYGMVAKPMEGLTITNAGKNVNTKQSEYAPFLSPDGKEMYYVGLQTDDIIEVDDKNNDYHAKILKSGKGDKGWDAGSPLGENINRPGYFNSNVSISPDGKRMFFSRQQLAGHTLSESKIYMSTKKGNDWGAANEIANINGEFLSKSPVAGELFGNEVLFFVSNMDGGQGGYDLYYATHEGDGKYGNPVNLGPKLNTVANEESPFYRDGMLYFSSEGHPGLGGYDIFQTEWDGTRWSEPKNMGPGFNSSVDDLDFMLDAEGFKGLLASNRIYQGARSVKSKTCCNDIYNVNLKKIEADLLATTFDINGEVLTGVTLELITYEDETPKVGGSKTNAGGNDFAFPLELDRAYMIIARHENYEADTVEFNTVGLIDSRTFNEKLNLTPLPKYITITNETPFELENIYYDFDDDKIVTDAEPSLQFVYELLSEYPDMVIELTSHTDARGDDRYNRELSQRRAESARRWLINKGITRRRVEAKGYGETAPKKVTEKLAGQFPFLKEGDELTEAFIETMATDSLKEEAHQINRRTEFQIIDGPKSIKVEERRLIQLGNKKVDEVVEPAKDKNTMPKAKVKVDTNKVHKFSSLYGKKNLTGVPIMEFDNREIDFGTIKKGEKREHVYTFKNVGDTTLEIDLIQACECTEHDYSRKTVKPGETGEIFIIFDSSEKEAGEIINIDIYLKNSEPDTGYPIMEMLQYKFELE